ncbi:protein kinase family protein [Streptomyces sp. SID3343]|uniref:protein kinase family protein n=1 Tax=Streptomyces sp. SID3343 TaxID=2690260 RepID=UPI001369103D|nr:protein kinase family protein [Streptomyces sp. SID3343]MYV98159.1 serine/threonine protein kinase [Streptomyces sp. SID3343]
MTDRTAGSVDLATDDPDPVSGKASDAVSDNSDGSDAKVSASTTTVLPIGSEPEPPESATSEIVSLDAESDAEPDGDGDAPEADNAPVENAPTEAKSVAGKGDTDEPGTSKAAAASSDAAPSGAPKADAPKSPVDESGEGDAAKPEIRPAAPEAEPEPTPLRVSRGTRLAARYRLEHRLSQNGRSETWRAVDEKLRRAVGVHIVPAGGEHGRAVIAAARAAALMGDPRFVQVLDCAEQDGLIYVVKEWLPDADNLTKVFESAPLPRHEVYELAGAVAQAMSVAHRAGLSHLRLTPENVLRMHTGQYKIVGLAVEAALYGHDTTDAARDDVQAVGALMYAALTRRWPTGAEYGLQAAPFTSGRLCAPGQIRAGVDDALAALTMRALGHEAKHEPAFGTPGELSAAISAMPEILPPEPDEIVGGPAPDYPSYTPTPTRPIYSTGGHSGGTRPPTRPTITPPPPLGGRFGATVKAVVAVIVVLAIVLVTWQIASHASDQGEEKKGPLESQSHPTSGPAASVAPPAPLPIRAKGAKEIGIGREPVKPEKAGDTIDGDPETVWSTGMFLDGPPIDYAGRKGYGIAYDLGTEQDVKTATVVLGHDGKRTTIALKAAPPGTTSMPNSESAFTVDMAKASTDGATLTITADKPAKARFVLLVMTENPKVSRGNYKGYEVHTSGYQNAWREVGFASG